MTKRDIYEEVTNKLIEALEQDIIPWRRPWRSSGVGTGLHANFKSKKPYRGVNVFLLEIAAIVNGWDYPLWLTFKQAQEMGGKVRKGERSTLVTFWKVLRIEEEDNGQKKVKKIPLLRHYNVFNVAQIEGIEDKLPQLPEQSMAPRIAECESIIRNMPNAPKTNHGGDRAFYSPLHDSVTLPHMEQFTSSEHYYATAFHEYVHSTGHESRTGRVKNWDRFGSDPYAQEELVAEMGAAMLCGLTGIQPKVESNTVAYLQNWVKVLKGDKKFAVAAAGQAQKAADFIMGETQEQESEEKVAVA